MRSFIEILLITILFIHNCSLEIDEKKPSRDVSDYDIRGKEYQSYPAKSQSMGLHENEYRKLGLQSDNMNGYEKSAYANQRNKLRMRHNRNGKFSGKRRSQDRDNLVFDYTKPRNLLQRNYQELKQQRLDNNVGELNEKPSTAEEVDVDKRFPFKKHIATKRWPFRRQRKFRGPKETPRVAKSENRQGGNDEDSFDYNDGDADSKGRAVAKSTNERFDDTEPADESLVMSFKSVNSHPDGGASCDKEATEEPACKTETEKAPAEEVSDRNQPFESEEDECDDNLRYLNFLGNKDPKCCTGDDNESDKSDLMNLNITINGVVMNNEKPSKICGNGTIKVNPGVDEDRGRRAIKIPFMKKFKQKQAMEEFAGEDDGDEGEKSEKVDRASCNQDPKESEKKEPAKCEEISNPDAGLTPDKLSNEIVKMVSHMVRSNPKMKTLWPSLRRNRPMNKGAACNLRTTANCSGRKQIEDMLRKAMASVNDIIEKEVQSRSCVPLSEDLAEFYEVILEMHAKQAKRKEEREEMLIQAEKLDKEPNDSDEKPKKKTCKPKPKRDEMDDLRDDDLFDLMHLRRLQYDGEVADARRRREAEKRTRELILDTANSSLVRKLRQMYSPAFLKLSSVVEGLQRSEAVAEQL